MLAPCADAPVANGAARAEWVVAPDDDPKSVAGINVSDLTLAADGSIYVIDSRESRITRLSPAGKVLSQWGTPGDGPGELRTPTSIAIGPEGDVYVASSPGGRITVFSAQGVYERTVRVDAMSYVDDVIVLPTGDIVVARNAVMEGGAGVYVAIVSASGERTRSVLSTDRGGSVGERPLVGQSTNSVRLTEGPGATFAVWYPYDSYVEWFNGDGTPIGTIVGCLPASVQRSYERQGRRSPDKQYSTFVTMGVRVQGDSVLRVASLYTGDAEHWILRVRRYTLSEGEVDARDYQIPLAMMRSKVFFASESTLFGFAFPFEGITRIRLDSAGSRTH